MIVWEKMKKAYKETAHIKGAQLTKNKVSIQQNHANTIITKETINRCPQEGIKPIPLPKPPPLIFQPL